MSRLLSAVSITAFVASLASLGCASVPLSGEGGPAAGLTLYVGPRFLGPEGDLAGLEVDAAGRIAAVYPIGTDLASVAQARGLTVRRLDGERAVPGLVDAHLHVTWIGRAAEEIDLSAACSAREVADLVQRFAVAHPEVPVLMGRDWDQTRWDGGAAAAFPTAADLGELDRPVVLTRVDGHAVWLNAVALGRARALIEAHANTPGTRVLRLASGALSGVIIDPPAEVWAALTPKADGPTLERWIGAALSRLAALGLVEVHDMATSPAELAAMQRLAEGGLPLRLVVYLDDSEASLTWLEAHRRVDPAGDASESRSISPVAPDLVVAGLKLFADGSLGSRGAALKADYSDEPGHRGQAVDGAALIAKAERAARAGYPVAIHAIGDRGVDLALAAVDAANAVTPGLRHRIEHAQVVDPADLAHFHATGATASMQPTHATSDMRWAEARLGARIVGAYAWRTMLARSIPLVFGSDAPVESPDPRLGLWAAVFRQTVDGNPPDGWRAQEALTLREALAAFSHAAWRAAPLGPERGVFKVGARFDATLFDRDIVADPRALLAAKVVGRVR